MPENALTWGVDIFYYPESPDEHKWIGLDKQLGYIIRLRIIIKR